MAPDPTHDALPWFVNGTLDAEGAAAFELHLAGCADCKKELEILEKLKAQIECEGDDVLADHPSPEKLDALLDTGAGDEALTEDEAVRLRRHLALCAACAEEASRLRGESIAGVSDLVADVSRSSAKRWRWAAAAGWLLAAAILTLWIRQSTTYLGPGPIRPAPLEETTRDVSQATEVAVPRGASDVYLALEVDFAFDAFPLLLEIVDGRGKRHYAREIAFDDLSEGFYLQIGVPRRLLPDGDYRLRLTGSGGETRPRSEYPFRIVGAPGP